VGDVLLFDENQRTRRTITIGGVGNFPSSTNTAELVGCRHAGMEGGKVAHHALVLILLVGMDGLCMLTKVVKA